LAAAAEPGAAGLVPENELTSSLSADSRARTTRDLVVAVLESAASEQPLVVVLEDAHWMDSSSWALAEEVVKRIPRLMLLVSTRPSAELNEYAVRLAAHPDACVLVLGPLPADGDPQLALGACSLKASATRRVAPSPVEGHPLFAEARARPAIGALDIRQNLPSRARLCERRDASPPPTRFAGWSPRIDRQARRNS
jgi:hypothetical protein